jgi:hypothetical protein
MSLKIEIPDSHVGSLKEYYKGVFEKFKIKAQPVLDEWYEISPILNQLGIIGNNLVGANYFTKKTTVPSSTIQSTIQSLNGYDKTWGWLAKSEYIIRKNGAGLTPKEILNQLVNVYEPDLNEKLARNSLPATLSVAANDGKIIRTKNKNNKYEYNVK